MAELTEEMITEGMASADSGDYGPAPKPRTMNVSMNTITLPWEDWRAVIAVLRESAVPYMREHADIRERQLEGHAPDEATVRLSLTDDVFRRSSNWARWQLGTPLLVDG
jgi:hypothetical protein